VDLFLEVAEARLPPSHKQEVSSTIADSANSNERRFFGTTRVMEVGGVFIAEDSNEVFL
jgi:hypothetical protein